MAIIYTPTANTKALYHLEDLNDSSPTGANLSNVGAASFVAGKFNDCVDLGASNTTKYLSTSNNLGLDSAIITMSCWVNITTAPGTNTSKTIIYHGSLRTIEHIDYEDIDGVKKLGFHRLVINAGWQEFYYDITLTPGEWYHVAFVYTGSYVNGYLNGAYVGQVAAGGNGTGGGYDEGCRLGMHGQFVQYLSGKIDEAIFEDKAWSDAEMIRYYKNGGGFLALM